MKHWTVQKLVFSGIASVVVIAVALCLLSLRQLGTVEREASDLKREDLPQLIIVSEIQGNVHVSTRASFELLVLDNPEAEKQILKIIEKNRLENDRLFAELEAIITHEGERHILKEVSEHRARHSALRERFLTLLSEEDSTAARRFQVEMLVPAQETYLEGLNRLAGESKEGAQRSLEEIVDAVQKARRVYLAMGGAAIALAVVIGYAIMRAIGISLRKLMLALVQVNGTSKEMTATLKEQQVAANEVASTSVEIGATAKEISATTKELGKTMADVASVAEQTAQLAVGGQAGLSRLEGTMQQIMEATSGISSKLAIMNDKTANINSVVTTINKVADQTNLLSLNAAIEAEKAGEFGQGFSVVATEIRRLADQTAVATYDIEQMVKEMQSAVSAGVMGMDKFAEEVRRGNEEVCNVTVQLVQIIQQVQALMPRFDAVNEGMQSQTSAAGQISDALVQLGETAQQSAQALRQNTEAIDQLTEAARGLKEAASNFKSVEH